MNFELDTIFWMHMFEPRHGISNYVVHVCATSKVSMGAKIRNRYNQVPHQTQDTNGKAANSQLDTTNESQEASPPSRRHKARTNRRAQKHSKHKTEQKT